MHKLGEALETGKAARENLGKVRELVPGLSLALCALLGVTGLGRSTLIVETAMPVVTQTVVAAADYGADEQFAAQGAALSTLACFIVIPVLMLIL